MRKETSLSCLSLSSLTLLVLFIRPNLHRRRLQHKPQRAAHPLTLHLLLILVIDTPQPRNLEAHDIGAPAEPTARADIGKRRERVRDDGLGMVQRAVAGVDVDLAKGLDARGAARAVGVVAQRHGRRGGAERQRDEAGVAADVRQVGAQRKRGEVRKVDLQLEAVGGEDGLGGQALVFVAGTEGFC